jgi:enoyl-CoA hydratase/carnithine racemase
MTDLIQYYEAEGVATLTLNRPSKGNAITSDMYRSLAQYVREAEGDDAVAVISIQSSGATFTAGHDLNEFLSGSPTGPDNPPADLIQAVSKAEKPVVAVVDGAAVGIGTTLLLHCDLVLASRSAWFQLPFVELGLLPEAGSSLLLPRLMGYHKAAELVFLGQPFDAETALSIGLVNRMVDRTELASASHDVLHRLAAQPSKAIRLAKSLLRNSTTDLDLRIAEEWSLFEDQLGSSETIKLIRSRLGGSSKRLIQ